jgi:hypothetical protein
MTLLAGGHGWIHGQMHRSKSVILSKIEQLFSIEFGHHSGTERSRMNLADGVGSPVREHRSFCKLQALATMVFSFSPFEKDSFGSPLPFHL